MSNVKTNNYVQTGNRRKNSRIGGAEHGKGRGHISLTVQATVEHPRNHGDDGCATD